MSGFLDPRRARSDVRKVRLRMQLQAAQRSIAALLDVLDHGADADGEHWPASFKGAVRLTASDEDSGVGCLPVYSIESRDVREKELLEGADLILQLINSLGVGLGHGLFSVPDVTKRKRPADCCHCLSGDAK
ncbi:MAG: hypothetical protein ACK5NN_00380 [Sphingomonadaceae bacterium]